MSELTNDNPPTPTTARERFNDCDFELSGKFTATLTDGRIFITAGGKSAEGSALLDLIQIFGQAEEENASGELELCFARSSAPQNESAGKKVIMNGRFGIDMQNGRTFIFAERGTEGGDALFELKRDLHDAPIGREERSPGDVIELQLKNL